MEYGRNQGERWVEEELVDYDNLFGIYGMGLGSAEEETSSFMSESLGSGTFSARVQHWYHIFCSLAAKVPYKGLGRRFHVLSQYLLRKNQLLLQNHTGRETIKC